MEEVKNQKPGIIRRSVGCLKDVYNHKNFVRYSLYTVAGSTTVLAIWVFFRKRQKKRPISLSSISNDNLDASPLRKDVHVSQINRSAGERLYLELGSGASQAMMSSSESCSSLTNSMSSEDLNVVIHECLSRGLRELKMGLDLSGYDGSRSGKRSRHQSTNSSTLYPSESECSTPGSLRSSGSNRAPSGRKRVNSRRRMGSISNSMSNSTASTTEILEEVATILKAQQRIEQIIESDPSLASSSDSIKEIIQHVRTESESSGNESVASQRTVRSGRWSPSGSSVDSFMTADEDFELTTFPFLGAAYELADDDRIYTRKIRYELCGVKTEREFLAKLHCIREAEKLWLSDKASRVWLKDVTCVILTGLLQADGSDPEPCQENFESLCDWCEDNYEEMCKSLSHKGICEISIFDVVIDLCLLDGLDLLSSPPAAMMSVLSNRWMSDDFKKTAMTTALWSYISRCRSDPVNNNPFMGKLLDLAKTITPAICWGQMGPQRKFGELLRSFKSEIISLCQDLFAYRDSWGSKEHLSKDLRNVIASTCHRLIDILNEKTESEILFVEPPKMIEELTEAGDHS